MKNPVAENIKSARTAAGLNQTELAGKLSTTQQQVSKWESGEQSPTVEKLIEIAGALGVQPAELLQK